jgi:hypothetical protein
MYGVRLFHQGPPGEDLAGENIEARPRELPPDIASFMPRGCRHGAF